MRAVFTLITFIFVICVSYTVSSFKEMPLSLLELQDGYEFEDLSSAKDASPSVTTYGALPRDEVCLGYSLNEI